MRKRPDLSRLASFGLRRRSYTQNMINCQEEHNSLYWRIFVDTTYS